jgi:hypothetical protein
MHLAALVKRKENNFKSMALKHTYFIPTVSSTIISIIITAVAVQ